VQQPVATNSVEFEIAPDEMSFDRCTNEIATRETLIAPEYSPIAPEDQETALVQQNIAPEDQETAPRKTLNRRRCSLIQRSSLFE